MSSTIRVCIVAMLAGLSISFVAGCSHPNETGAGAAAPATASTTAAWPTLVDEFLETYFKAHPQFAAYQGRHEFDGSLPDWSAAGIHAEAARLKAFRTRVLAVSAATLDAPSRMERDVMLARIERDLFWIETAEAPFKNPGFYTGNEDGVDSLDPSVYVARPYGTPEIRLKAFIHYAHEVVRVAPSIRANLRTPMPMTYVKLGEAGFGGYAQFYRKDVPAIFASVTDPALQAELKAAIEPAAAAMDGLATWMRGEEAHATGIDALGPERFAAMLKATEQVDLPLAELEAAGRADLERNTAALKAACHEYAKGATIDACILRTSELKTEGGAVAGARAQLSSLRQFIVDKDILTIPGKEEATVAESPAYNRENGAYIDIPGPYDRDLPSVYNIAPPNPTWSKAEQAAYVPGRASLLFTSVHEVWPGHFLQFMHANRAPSKLASVFVGYAFAEGWAHYTEELMWEKGLGGDPETHIGQLTNALLRNVRFLSSIGMQTQGMTLEASEKMFLERAYADAGTARQQAARGTYDPGYINYTLGKLMIRKLRTDWSATHGGEAGWKAFHDQFLSYGGPPIPLVRAAMLPGDKGKIL